MESRTRSERPRTRTGHEPGPDPFLRRVVTAVGVGALALVLLVVLWQGVEILLVVFGGILLATFLLALRDFLTQYTAIPEGWALTLVVLLLTALIGVGGWLLAPQVLEQADELGEAIPQAVQEVEEYLGQYEWGRQLLDAVQGGTDSERVMEVTQLTLASASEVFGYLLTFIFVGLFVAANPTVYRNGIVRLVPQPKRDRAREVLDELGNTLRWWLIGQAMAMILIGVSTGIVLALFGIPLAIVLGILVGVLGFIPYLGPILGAIPVAMIAAMQGPTTLLYVMLAYTGVQVIEGYVVTPLIQHRMVYLPPALTITAQVLLGTLLGLIGFVLATPLAAVLMVFIQMTYVEGMLGDPVREEEQE